MIEISESNKQFLIAEKMCTFAIKSINQPMIKVILRKEKEKSLLRKHPWVFSGAIYKIEGNVEDGDVVSVYDSFDKFWGIGHYHRNSIAVRILSFQDEAIDQSFFVKRISEALDVRKSLGLLNNPETNMFRLVHGESDGLSGLIIDYYKGNAVIQAHSIGMYKSLSMIKDALLEVFDNKLISIYDKSSGTLPFLELNDRELFGKCEKIVASEYGNSFNIDVVEGQKTGFFIDQKENRHLVQQYAKDRNVLNTFSYSGGFSVSALRGGASNVDSVDSSKLAVELCRQNIELNFPNNTKHEEICADVFDYLSTMPEDKYDLVILDPPAFAKHRDALKNALQAYKRLNQKAITNIKKNGILFTFSCSQAVSTEDFRKAVFAAAVNSGRNVRILHFLTQSPDHPISIFHPEGEYLKGLVLHIE